MNKIAFSIFAISAMALVGCGNDEADAPDNPVDDGSRPATPYSSPYQTKVYEYLPGPGQFINEPATGGFTGNEKTADDAAKYAEKRLSEQKFVSLGSFGGYIVVGFDHSIFNSRGGYDFAIRGNAMDTSNEPGIVWVMQDANRNGLPDDKWHELKGSETGKPSTVKNYSVTYFKPAEPGMPVDWIDSEGNKGQVDYLKAYHKQDYYYPSWVGENSYTLTGTRLASQNSQDGETGYWSNEPFAWGYADNLGGDSLGGDKKLWTGFKISNAMRADGSPIDLDYIDFIMVQQGVLAKSGWLGENSCEVFSFADYSMIFK